MIPTERIDQAFLQLEFAIKLLTYVELGKLDKKEFDVDVTLLLKENNLTFRNDTFQKYDDLINAVQNNYNITLGFTAILLNSCFEEAGTNHDPKDNLFKAEIRSLIYMIRCAFAHDMMSPKWEVRGKYNRILNIQFEDYKLEINLCKLDGQPFEVSQIGGIDNYYKVKDAAQGFLITKK